MKRSIALAIAILTSPVLSSFAGDPVASWKNPIAPPLAPVEDLYRAHELQADFFGAYAVTPDTGNRTHKDSFSGELDHLDPQSEAILEEELRADFPGILPGGNFLNTLLRAYTGSKNVTIPFKTSEANRFLGNHAWGGGGAINYFFTRNFGVGLEGTALRATGYNQDMSGQFGLNLLARLPIGNTGWAPYAIAGVGGFIPGYNGNRYDKNLGPDEFAGLLGLGGTSGDIKSDSGKHKLSDYKARITVRDKNSDDIIIEGHAGLGIEYRFTKNIGIFTDGRFTLVHGEKNNYALIRSGVRFAF